MKYSKADITQWLLGSFKVQSRKGNELNFPCPVCEHESFYFNVQKQTGYCHRAACHKTLNVRDLIDIIGYSPELAGYVPSMYVLDSTPLKELSLPAGSVLIEERDEVVAALATRGVTWNLIQKFRLHQTKTQIVVPVYDGDDLVQYNCRRINRKNPVERWFKDLPEGVKPYNYASGYPITNHFLGWSECKLWGKIVLVENTFVSMWLRDLYCTTTFGSHLSDAHVHKLIHSNIKHVTMLWDEGANAQRAERKLKSVGIPCRVINIKGQPDDYSKDEIKEMLKWEL